jgi:hypothetical protein
MLSSGFNFGSYPSSPTSTEMKHWSDAIDFIEGGS